MRLSPDGMPPCGAVYVFAGAVLERRPMFARMTKAITPKTTRRGGALAGARV